MTARADAAWRRLAGAVTLLTVVPVPGAGVAALGDSAAWFPLVGAAVGGLAGAVRLAAEHTLGPLTATVLAVTALVVVTGALHQDGLADTADGVGARDGRERRLAVMRDSSTGAFGVLALIAWFLLMVTAPAQLTGVQALLTFVAACAVGRWAALLHATAAPPARADGLGASLTVSRPALLGATALAAAAAIATGLPDPVKPTAALAAGALVAILASIYARDRLGGYTGDTLGATVALGELVVCLTLTALWR